MGVLVSRKGDDPGIADAQDKKKNAPPFEEGEVSVGGVWPFARLRHMVSGVKDKRHCCPDGLRTEAVTKF